LEMRHRDVMVLQEAQLSQTDRAMLHVIKYFAKSLKVTALNNAVNRAGSSWWEDWGPT